MKLSLKNDHGVNRRIVLLIVLVAIVVTGLCLFGFLLTQIAPLQKLAELVPVSSTPTQVAGNVAAESPTSTPAAPADTSTPSPTESIPSPTPTPIPSPTLTPTLTPTPTNTPMPTLTPTLTRTPTNTPTPDPWVSLGQWRVACSTELIFDPVSASRFKFQMVAGGGDDKQISFYCCGSGGAEFFVNDAWLPVANPSLTLRVGETRETTDFGSAVVSRARFNIGCNDGEQMDVHAYYLPAPTPTITATATLTSTLALTTTATLTATVSVSATATLTSTLALTTTATLTATIPVSATATPTSTLAPTGTLTVTSAVTATATVTATRPPAPSGGIAFHKNDNGIDRAFVFNLDNNTVTPLVDIGPVMDLALSTNAPFGAWSPDNSKFVYISTVSPGGSNILRVVDFQANTTRALFSSDTGGGLSSPTWSPDGTKITFVRLAANQRVWAIDVVNADATRCATQYICEVTSNPRGEQFRGGLSWSKQGLYVLASNTTGANDVYAVFADGSVRVNLTNNPADNSTPIWSPDGKLIAFTSTRDGLPQIYLMNADGSGLRRVSQGDAGDVSPTWSPDGNWIAFASTRDGSTDIYMMDLNGGNVTRLTKTGGDHPIWSH